jgi:hypothetical protein
LLDARPRRRHPIQARDAIRSKRRAGFLRRRTGTDRSIAGLPVPEGVAKEAMRELMRLMRLPRVEQSAGFLGGAIAPWLPVDSPDDPR